MAAAAIAKKGVKGADTGFWKDVENDLKSLSGRHGTNRETAGWKEFVIPFYTLSGILTYTRWEQNIINTDRVKYIVSEPDAHEDSEPEEDEEQEDVGAGMVAAGVAAQAQALAELQMQTNTGVA